MRTLQQFQLQPVLHYRTLQYTATTIYNCNYTALHYTTLITFHQATLHSTTLHSTKLYTSLHYTTLKETTLHYITLHYTTQTTTTNAPTTTLHYTMLLTVHSATLHSITLYYAQLHYATQTTTTTTNTPLHYTMLNCTTLHFTTLNYAILHYTTLHYPRDAFHRGDPDDSPIPMSSPLLLGGDLSTLLFFKNLFPQKLAQEPRKNGIASSAHTQFPFPVLQTAISSSGKTFPSLRNQASGSKASETGLKAEAKRIVLGAGRGQLQVNAVQILYQRSKCESE